MTTNFRYPCNQYLIVVWGYIQLVCLFPNPRWWEDPSVALYSQIHSNKSQVAFHKEKGKMKESLNPWNDIGSIQHFNNSLAVFNTWTLQAMKWYWHHHYRKWSWKYSTFNNSFTHPSTWKILVLIFSKKGIFINQHKCTTKLITMAQTARFTPCWHSVEVTVKYNMEDGNPLSNPILYWKLVGGLFT